MHPPTAAASSLARPQGSAFARTSPAGVDFASPFTHPQSSQLSWDRQASVCSFDSVSTLLLQQLEATVAAVPRDEASVLPQTPRSLGTSPSVESDGYESDELEDEDMLAEEVEAEVPAAQYRFEPQAKLTPAPPLPPQPAPVPAAVPRNADKPWTQRDAQSLMFSLEMFWQTREPGDPWVKMGQRPERWPSECAFEYVQMGGKRFQLATPAEEPVQAVLDEDMPDEVEPRIEVAARLDKGKQRAVTPPAAVPAIKERVVIVDLTWSDNEEDSSQIIHENVKMEDTLLGVEPSGHSTSAEQPRSPPTPARAPPLGHTIHPTSRPAVRRLTAKPVKYSSGFSWTFEEDARLRSVRDKIKNKRGRAIWEEVQQSLPNRTAMACRVQYFKKPLREADSALVDPSAAREVQSTAGPSARSTFARHAADPEQPTNMDPVAPVAVLQQPVVAAGFIWTARQDAILRQRVSEGKAWRDIARELAASKSGRQCEARWTELQLADESDEERRKALRREASGCTNTDWLQPYSNDPSRRWDHREYRLGHMVKAMKGEPTEDQLEALYATFSFAERKDVRAKARSLAEKYKREAVERERVGTAA